MNLCEPKNYIETMLCFMLKNIRIFLNEGTRQQMLFNTTALKNYIASLA